jgi:hypothetical protein
VVTVPEEGVGDPQILVLTRGKSIAGRLQWPDATPAVNVPVHV